MRSSHRLPLLLALTLLGACAKPQPNQPQNTGDHDAGALVDAAVDDAFLKLDAARDATIASTDAAILPTDATFADAPADDMGAAADSGVWDASVMEDAAFASDADVFDAGTEDAGPVDAGTSDAGSHTVSGLDPILTFTLRNAAFPGSGHADVAVHVPDGFDLDRSPGAVLYFHGWENCAANAIGATNTVCTTGGPAREAMNIAGQLDTANVNALLIGVQLRFDEDSGNPGNLAMNGVCHAMVDELLTEHLSDLFPYAIGADDLSNIVLASHSGGYWATAECLSVGGFNNIGEVELYDSLYGELGIFEPFITDDISLFDPSASLSRRFSSVFIGGTSTATESSALYNDIDSAFADAGQSSLILPDFTTDTLIPADFATPILFKQSALGHNDIPRYYFQRIVAHARFERLH